MSGVRVQAVLFDLDGTLIDSAPDLAGAANALRAVRGLPPLPYEALRPLVGTGARGMVGAALGAAPGDADFIDLRDEFLQCYQRDLLRLTRIFDDAAVLIDELDRRGMRWGVVTNKAERFALPVLTGLQLLSRSAVTVCGDTTPHAKPHPEPLLEAARRLGLAPADCVYVGDDLRDVQAGKAAGMPTLAAAWGYLGQGESIDEWGADAIVDRPAEVLKWLAMD
jgi:phosphoglycolate phosphatase